MPPTLTPEPVESLSDYMELVERQTEVRWYRGTGNAAYNLMPSLYRHPILTDAPSLFRQEYDIIKRFRQTSMPYLSNPLKEDEDLNSLFLMQHFGVPTRLLDWTENPYIALYFALTDAHYEKNGNEAMYTTDAAVWMLDPNQWNGKALDFDPSPGVVSPPDNDLLNGYLPAATTQRRKPEPVALYGVHNSPRIVAQRGVFTLFGTNVKPMEQSYIDNDYPQDCLVKIGVDKNYIKDMLKALVKIGFTDSVVYPDLPGLAKEIKRQFGYWV